MATPPLLQHIHIRGLSPFSKILALQNKIVTQNLLHKSSPSTHPAPLPTIISFTPPPIYTFGRRSPPSLLDDLQIAKLKEPLRDWHSGLRLGANVNGDLAENVEVIPEVEGTQRGGLTTFHGPGQVVLFPVLDLKGDSIVKGARNYVGKYEGKGLDVRSYVCLLENTTIGLLKGEFGIQAKRTENPGVWVDVAHLGGQVTAQGKIEAFERELWREGGEYEAVDCKIAALGVHLRRHVTSYGLAINCSTDLRWFDRITACGLEGLGTTSIRQLGTPEKRGLIMKHVKVREDMQQDLAGIWTRRFVSGIWGIPGPFGKRVVDDKWNYLVQSRVWGADMDGSGEGLGIEDVSERLQNTIGKWPLRTEDPVPKERVPSKSAEKDARVKALRERNGSWARQKAMQFLDDEIKEIRKQIWGRKLYDTDIRIIIKGLHQKMTGQHKAALDKSKEVNRANSEREKKLETSGYRMDPGKLITSMPKGNGASVRRPALHVLLRRDKDLEEAKKIARELESEMVKMTVMEQGPLRSQLEQAKDKIQMLERIGMDDEVLQEEMLVTKTPLIHKDEGPEVAEEKLMNWTPLVY